MSWQVEVALVVVLLAVCGGATAYLLRQGGEVRRSRRVQEKLQGMVGGTVTVVIGGPEDQDPPELQELQEVPELKVLQALSRVRGTVVSVDDDKLVLSPADGRVEGTWVWPVDDGTVRVRLERIVGIEDEKGETVFT